MKILILNWRDIKHPRAGGAERRLHEVYAPLVTLGHEVILYSCFFSGASKKDCIDGINVYRKGNDWTFSLLCTLNLNKWVKYHNVDIVVEDLNKLPFFSPLVYKGPLLIQMHHLWRGSVFRETIFPLAFLIWLSEKSIGWFYKKSLFSVVSPSTQNELIRLGIPKENIKVIYNGSNLDVYRPIDCSKKPIILWVGRMQKYKGPLEACKILELLLDEYPNLRLVFVGDGPYRKTVEKYSKKKSLPVEFTGFLKQKEKISWMQKASVHLQSSFKEGWGLTIIEANACGCPVVANNTAGLRDSCRDNETGLLYQFGNIKDASEKIKIILENQEIRNKLVKNGIKWSSSFSWERNSKEILNLIESLITQDPS